jgi:ribosomal protein S27E
MLLAQFRDEEIFPADLPNDIAKKNTCGPTDGPVPHCPECGEQVTHRDQGANGKVAHFAHCPQSYDGCPGSTVGESAEHDAMKSIAVGVVEDRLSVPVSASGTEEQLPAPYSEKEHRKADGLIRFDGRDEQLGDGLAIEVQYRNKQKDLEATTLDYIRGEESIAVLWLWEDDFDMEADSPEDWALPLGDADDIRERVRRQVWPRGESESIWEPVNGPSYPGMGITPHPPYPDSGPVLHSWPRGMALDAAMPTSRDCPAKLPPDAVDDLAQSYKEEQDWSSLFTATHAQKYISEVHDHFDLPAWRVPVSVPRPATLNLVERRLLEAAKTRHEDPRQTPSPPPTAFDDMQCWDCGHYWYAYESSPRLQCRNCGAPVDVKWNYDTGRISEIPFLPEQERLQPEDVAVTDGGVTDE